MSERAAYRGCFRRDTGIRFLSHLDILRLFTRAIRRAGLPVACSCGFNPQPKISFASALPLGVTSDREYFDLVLERSLPLDEIANRLNESFPDGISVTKITELPASAPAAMAEVNRAFYIGLFPTSAGEKDWETAVEKILVSREIFVERSSRRKKKTINIRPLIFHLAFNNIDNNRAEVEIIIQTGNQGGVRVGEISSLFDQYDLLRHDLLPRFHRKGLYIAGEDVMLSPLDVLRSEYVWSEN